MTKTGCTRGAPVVAYLLVALAHRACAAVPFLRGDVNQDGKVSLSDINFMCPFFECGVSYVEIPPAEDLVPVLNLLGTIPEGAEVNTTTELVFTEQESDAGTLRTEVVARSGSGDTRVPGTLRGGSITVVAPVRFVRGDTNLDGRIELSDAIHVLRFLFLGGEGGSCSDASDIDDNGIPSLSDAIRLLGFLFLGDPPPAAPWPECGVDPTADVLACKRYPGC